MQVNKDEVAGVFACLGVTGYLGTADQLTLKLNVKGGIATYRKKGHQFTDPKAAALFQTIDDAQEKGALFRVVDGPAPKPAKVKLPKTKVVPAKASPVAKPAPKRTGGKPGRPKPAPAEERVKKKEWFYPDGRPRHGVAPLWVWREYRVEHPAVMTATSNARAVFDALAKAGAGKVPKPLTKADLLAVLKEKCPTRDAKKMETNLNNLIPTRLRNVYRIFVWSAPTASGKGYYVVGDGRTPQPKAEKGREK